ncbi:MAG: rRNA maturation RNase YbeY [Bacteroidales bacterium]|jgi:rRNA maturation RNase YbeY|nr:rRNA maturation RNase YbeY [Bacteroidales bacterium]
MILFFSETNFRFSGKKPIKEWLGSIITKENKKVGDINIVFYDDEKLSEFNKSYLNHDTLTDIITFDYSENGLLGGDICISVERVKDNAQKFNCSFEEELRRVMVHGILHLCGYRDRSRTDKLLMKQKEEEALFLFNIQYK